MKSINLEEEIQSFKKDILVKKNEKGEVYMLQPATKRDILRSDIKTLKEILASQECIDYLLDNDYEPEDFIAYCQALVNEKGDTV